MYKRLLFLAFGWRTRDPHECAVQRALWGYHRTLFGSALLTILPFYGLGFLLTGDMLYALYFLLLLPVLGVTYTIRLLWSAIKVLLILGCMFVTFYLFAGGSVHIAIAGVIGVLFISFIFAFIITKIYLPTLRHDNKISQFSECYFLTYHLQDILCDTNIPIVNVYIREGTACGAQICKRSGVHTIFIDEQMYGILSPHAIRGVLAHEVGHLLIPFGGMTFSFLEHFVFGMGSKYTLFFEKKADTSLEKLCIPLAVAVRNGKYRIRSMYRVWKYIAFICSLISPFPASRKREEVADACGALILRDARPLTNALSGLNSTQTHAYSDTHSTHAHRISNLRRIKYNAGRTR